MCCEEVQVFIDLCSGDRCLWWSIQLKGLTSGFSPGQSVLRTLFFFLVGTQTSAVATDVSKVGCESETNQRKVWMSFTFLHNQTSLLWQSWCKRTGCHPVSVELLNNSRSHIQTNTRVQVAHLLNDKCSGLHQSPGDNWLQRTALQAAVSRHRWRLLPHLYLLTHLTFLDKLWLFHWWTQPGK